jgi:hypothetical protein
MSGTAVIEFSDLVKVAKGTADMLGTKPKHEILSSAESFILGKATGKEMVELRVPKNQQYLWSKLLQDLIDDALAKRDGGRSPVSLCIVYT